MAGEEVSINSGASEEGDAVPFLLEIFTNSIQSSFHLSALSLRSSFINQPLTMSDNNGKQPAADQKIDFTDLVNIFQ